MWVFDVTDDAASRLRNERKRLGLSQVDFGKLGGVSKNTQMAYENGASPITLDYLDRLSDHGVDLAFVATGRPSGGHQITVRNAGNDRRLPFHGAEPDERPDLVEIDEIDLRYGLGATFVDGPVEAEKRVFSRSWLRLFTRARPESLFWTIGDGDSMEPTIRSGEIVLIDRSQDTIHMAEGIWAVTLGDFGMIKRVHSPDGQRIELRSDNQLIPPIAVAQDELHVIGRVVAVVRRL